LFKNEPVLGGRKDSLLSIHTEIIESDGDEEDDAILRNLEIKAK
jgi:hypothetical protein